METTWILVAHRSGAQLFERQGRKDLNLLQDIPHTERQLTDSELYTDKPGRAFDRAGKGRHCLLRLARRADG